MDPIQGTNVSLDVYLSSMQAAKTRDALSITQVKLALDTQKTVGSELVEMLENLGKNIDTYV